MNIDESRKIFSLKENEQITRKTLFDKYMKLLAEHPEKSLEIVDAYKTLTGSSAITYPPIQARQLIKNTVGVQNVHIPNWYTNTQASREEIRYIKTCIDELLEEPYLMIKTISTIFYLTRNLEKELENISHPSFRETYINYLKMVDQKLKRNYELVNADKLIVKNTEGQRKL